MKTRTRLISIAALIGLLGVIGSAGADSGPGAPVASRPVARGGGAYIPTPPSINGPWPKTVDGQISDWPYETSRFAGITTYSRGELVYQDYINDAYGADDGRDARRVAVHDQAVALVPETYRAEPAQQYVPDEVGVPVPDELAASMNYGDMPHQDEADLEELRLGADSDYLYVMARTTTMKSPVRTSLLLLIDNGPGGTYTIPFNAHITSDKADIAVLLSDDKGWIANLATNVTTALPSGDVASDPTGFKNALEARIALSGLGTIDQVAAATGLDGNSGSLTDVTSGNSLANVAFRPTEPVRGNWFDKQQALALYNHNIDGFFQAVDVAGMQAGMGRLFQPGPGYHSRIFVSSPTISTEGGENGIFQHYGLYIPTTYAAPWAPLQFWLHWRGGRAHTAAAVSPRIFQHYGEDQGSIVVSPNGRGTSRWYIGQGLVDFQEVWDDLMWPGAPVVVDPNRVYVTGHSMGGWGSQLLTILYPDRFAAAAPVSGPVTQGAWTGADFPGCDSFRSGEYTPCYIEANGGKARIQHTRRLLENVRNVPWAILTGNADELVPYAGVAQQASRLQDLGYRYRLYSFPNYEHYSLPLVDEWAEAARYEHQFTRNPNPARVSYIRDMPFEITVETIANDGIPLSFDFDKAYWMSELTPTNTTTGVAKFEGTSLAIPSVPYLKLPEAGGPSAIGQTGPFDMVGQSWLPDPLAATPATSNGFSLALTGVSAVRLDLARMSIDTAQSVGGTVTSNTPLALRLAGAWPSLPTVTVNGSPVGATYTGGILRFSLGTGTSNISVL